MTKAAGKRIASRKMPATTAKRMYIQQESIANGKLIVLISRLAVINQMEAKAHVGLEAPVMFIATLMPIVLDK